MPRIDFIVGDGGVLRPSVIVEPDGPVSSQFFPAGGTANGTTRVMAIGDSLTLGQGGSTTGGYRHTLWQKLAAAGLPFLPCGENTQPPYSDTGTGYYGSRWSGFGGWKMADLMDGTPGSGSNQTGRAIPEWFASHNPHVLLLMIGTNDLTETSNQTTLRARFNALLDLIYDLRPSIPIVLAKIPHLREPWGSTAQYGDMTAEVLAERVALNPARKTVVADMTAITGASKYSDAVHLGPTGYTEMADLWYDAVTTA